jgi:hypothetical protein
LQNLRHLAGERAIGGLLDLDDGLGLAGLVCDGLPAPGSDSAAETNEESESGRASNRALNSERMVSLGAVDVLRQGPSGRRATPQN